MRADRHVSWERDGERRFAAYPPAAAGRIHCFSCHSESSRQTMASAIAAAPTPISARDHECTASTSTCSYSATPAPSPTPASSPLAADVRVAAVAVVVVIRVVLVVVLLLVVGLPRLFYCYRRLISPLGGACWLAVCISSSSTSSGK